jgi:hypothetical protein
MRVQDLGWKTPPDTYGSLRYEYLNYQYTLNSVARVDKTTKHGP